MAHLAGAGFPVGDLPAINIIDQDANITILVFAEDFSLKLILHGEFSIGMDKNYPVVLRSNPEFQHALLKVG